MTARLLACVAVAIAVSFAAGPANPVAPTAASIEDGKKSFQKYCRQCHGPDATGGPEVGYAPAAPSLVDDTWKHGSSDGEIYLVIRNGIAPEMFMEPWQDRLTSEQTWNVVNYLRSLRKP